MKRLSLILCFLAFLFGGMFYYAPNAEADSLIGSCGNPLGEGAPDPLTINSPYGDRTDPVTGEAAHHGGVDIDVPGEDTPVYAVCDGTIYDAADSGVSGYEGWIVLEAVEDSLIGGANTQDGKVYFIYGHCVPAKGIYPGKNDVKRGDLLGYARTIGKSTGVHLHFAVQSSPNPGPPHFDPGLFCPSIPLSPEGLRMIGGPDAMKWSDNYDFGKYLAEPIQQITEACVKAIDLIKETFLQLFILFITMDLAFGLSMLMIDSQKGNDWFLWMLQKFILYGILLYFLENWAGTLANSLRDLFVTAGGASVGGTYADAVNALSNPFALLKKGAAIISPFITELNTFNKPNLSFDHNVGTIGFMIIAAVIIFGLLSIITLKIVLAYIEFYMMVLLGFVTFVTSGIKQLRYLSNASINAIVASTINLMFWSIFSLCLQLTMTQLSYEPIFSVQQLTPEEYASKAGVAAGEEMFGECKIVCVKGLYKSTSVLAY